jgi:hypothetical protein
MKNSKQKAPTTPPTSLPAPPEDEEGIDVDFSLTIDDMPILARSRRTRQIKPPKHYFD